MDIKRPHIHKHHFNFLFLLVGLLIIIIAILVKPALTGYKLTKQFEEKDVTASDVIKRMDTLRNDLAVCNNELKSYNRTNKQCLQKLTTNQNTTLKLRQKNSELKAEIEQQKLNYEYNITNLQNRLSQQKQTLTTKLEQLNQSYKELQQKHLALIENSARSICCKEKVDNEQIDSYIISDNKLVCTSGEENKIDC